MGRTYSYRAHPSTSSVIPIEARNAKPIMAIKIKQSAQTFINTRRSVII